MSDHDWHTPKADPLADMKAMRDRAHAESIGFPAPDPWFEFYAARLNFVGEHGRPPEANEPGGYIGLTDLLVDIGD